MTDERKPWEVEAAEKRAAIDAYLATLGITYVAEFVPQSRSRNAGDKQPTLNWKMSISRGRKPWVTDYMQGIGHVPGYNNVPKGCSLSHWHRLLAAAAETGNYPTGKGPGETVAFWHKPLPAPELRDVLYCNVSDAGVLDYDSFETWADEYQYDTDSRKAEATYRACLDTALKLRSILGTEAVDKLRELFQDY